MSAMTGQKGTNRKMIASGHWQRIFVIIGTLIWNWIHMHSLYIIGKDLGLILVCLLIVAFQVLNRIAQQVVVIMKRHVLI